MASAAPVSDDFILGVIDAANALGMDPETLTLPWYAESNLDPASSSDGVHFGINQIDQAYLTKLYGVSAADYRTWTAEQQLPIVMKDVRSRMDQFFGGKPFPDAAVYETANLLPSALLKGSSDDTVIFAYPSQNYTSNKGLDKDGNGYVTIGDVRTWLNTRSQEPPYQAFVARLRALEASPTKPSAGSVIVPLAIVALAASFIFLRSRD